MSDISHRALRLLHIEDNPSDAEFVASVLKEEWPDCGIVRVWTESSLKEALESASYDAVLSDFTLPGFDGMAALSLLRARDTLTPFIFLSGTIGEDNAVRALRRGATDYILKDRITRLVPAIKRAVSEVRETLIRRKVEEELRESQMRFQELTELSGEVLWFVQPNPEKVLYVSPAFEAVWGRPVAELYADPRAWEAAIHGEDRAAVHVAFNRCVRGLSHNFECEFRVVRPDGSLRWVLDSGSAIRDASGQIVRICGIAKDITERHYAQEALREQADLLSKARDAIVVADLSRRIVFWNQGAERIFGWTSAEVVGKLSTEIFGPSSVAEIDSVKQSLGADGWQGEIRLSDRHGRELVLESRVTLIRDADGKPKSHLIMSTDVTEKKQLERQFLRAQRLESIGTLAGGIAHDLNNVLAPMLMAVHLVQHRVKDPEIHRLMGVLEASGQHGASLIRQVLAFARGAEGARTNLQLRLVVREVVSLLGETLPRSIAVETQLADDLALVSADATQITQVLMNLCVNARDAMPNGGQLTIRAENVDVPETVARAHKGVQAGRYVLVEVRDTGTGIPPGLVDRIFDPFFTTKPAGKGTGLGLSTVLGIVRDHGGFVEVSSEPERGTRFSLHFPAATTAQETPPISTAPKIPSGANELVLIIDDEASVREIVRAFLESFGYRTLVAEDGISGLALFAQHRDEIAAVMTDMMMPGMQGREVVSRLREMNPRIPVVTMSGQLDDDAALPSDGHTRIQKPMTGEQLILGLQQVLPPRNIA